MLRRLLLLALCVVPAIAIECDKCTGKECFGFCYLRQKTLTAEARAKCGDGGGNDEDWKAKYDELKVEHDELKAGCGTKRTALDDGNIQTAVRAWDGNSYEASLTYGPIEDWDVSKVTDMSKLFEYYLNFNEDIGDWDVSAVTDMNNMFLTASNFNQDITNWDVSAVTDMSVQRRLRLQPGHWQLGRVRRDEYERPVQDRRKLQQGHWRLGRVRRDEYERDVRSSLRLQPGR